MIRSTSPEDEDGRPAVNGTAVEHEMRARVTETTPGAVQAASAQDVVSAALDYARRGWRVIPLHWVLPSGECSCSLSRPDGQSCPPRNRGKHPLNARWQNTPPMSAPDIYDTWGQNAHANIGIATGAPSGFFVLDIDPDNGGFDSMRQLVERYGPMPATLVQQTGSGGYHYLFQMPDFEVKNKATGKKWLGGIPGLDLRGTGGQIVVAPSVSGKGPYAFVTTNPIAPAPAWLLQAIWDAQSAPATTAASQPASTAPVPVDAAEAARLATYARRAIEAELARLVECSQKAVRDGERYTGPPWNVTTHAVACNLVEMANTPWSGLTHEMAEQLLMQYAPRDSGFTDWDVHKTLASARQTVGSKGRAAPAKPVDLLAPFGGSAVAVAVPSAGQEASPVPGPTKQTWDDLGNAQRIVAHFGNQIRWIALNNTWAVYDGRRWKLDDKQGVISRIQWLLANLDRLEGDLYSDEIVVDETDEKAKPTSERKKFKAWAAKQRMAARVDAAEKMARAVPALQAAPQDFDAYPMVLNVLNGIIDLASGELKPHDPALLLSQIANVAYDPAATAPRWEAFLAQVMPDPHMRAYLQRVSGYSASGDISEQAFFIHQGVGANGKSQYLVVMQDILGDYNQIVPRQTLLVKRGDAIPTDIARMLGKRFLQTSETAAGRQLDEEVVKNLTGEEGIVARHLYGKEFEHNPTGKIHYVTNHLPRLSDADSIWRRLHLFSWKVVIPEEMKVKRLGRMLAAEEGPGILNWIVKGCLAWQALGSLGQPDMATMDVQAYRSDQDELGEFLDDYVVPTAGGRCPMDLIYQAYVRWVGSSGLGHKALSKQTLTLAMHERGYERYRSGNERGFVGVGVRQLALTPFELL